MKKKKKKSGKTTLLDEQQSIFESAPVIKTLYTFLSSGVRVLLQVLLLIRVLYSNKECNVMGKVGLSRIWYFDT